MDEMDKEELLLCIAQGKLDEVDLLELATDNDFDLAYVSLILLS